MTVPTPCPDCGAAMIGPYCPSCLYEEGGDEIATAPMPAVGAPVAAGPRRSPGELLRLTVAALGGVVFVVCGVAFAGDVAGWSWTHEVLGYRGWYLLIASMAGLWCLTVAMSRDDG